MIRTLTISDLVNLNPKAGLVLFRNGVVFSNETGGQSLKEYCTVCSLNLDKIEKQLNGIIKNADKERFNPSAFSIQQLVYYLTQTHHEYVRVKIPAIRKLIENLFLETNISREYTAILCSAFAKFEKHLSEHIEFEERDVFPYILSLIEAAQKSYFTDEFLSFSRRLSISQILSQHTDEVDEMLQVKQAANLFEVEEKQPLAYKVTLLALKDLETDLQHHNQLENTHLFPQAKLLEEYLLRKANRISSWN